MTEEVVVEHDPEIVEEAKALGWKSPEEWVGEPSEGYIADPQRFVQRETRRQQEARAAKTEAELAEHARKMDAILDAQLASQKKAYDEKLAAIEARMAEAVDTGDTEAAKKILEEQKEVISEAPKEPEPAKTPYHTSVETWIADKPWWNSDMPRTRAAVFAYSEAEQQGITDADARLKHVESYLARLFPEPVTPEPQPAEIDPPAKVSGGLMLGGGQKTEFAALPKEAKEAYSKFVARGMIEDSPEAKADYAEEYNNA